MNFSRQIKKGIEWLDETYPDWENRVDVITLRQDDCLYCVLGQACNWHVAVMQATGEPSFTKVSQKWCNSCGFATDKPGKKAWSQLTTQWMRAIERKRDATY